VHRKTAQVRTHSTVTENSDSCQYIKKRSRDYVVGTNFGIQVVSRNIKGRSPRKIIFLLLLLRSFLEPMLGTHLFVCASLTLFSLTFAASDGSSFHFSDANPSTYSKRAMVLREKRDEVPYEFTETGVAHGDTILEFKIGLAPKDRSGLEKALFDVSTPGGPRYGQHLSAEEVLNLFQISLIPLMKCTRSIHTCLHTPPLYLPSHPGSPSMGSQNLKSKSNPKVPQAIGSLYPFQSPSQTSYSTRNSVLSFTNAAENRLFALWNTPSPMTS